MSSATPQAIATAPAVTTRRAPSRSKMTAGEQDQGRSGEIVGRDGEGDLGAGPAMALLERHEINPRSVEPEPPSEQRDQEGRRDDAASHGTGVAQVADLIASLTALGQGGQPVMSGR